MDDAKEDWPQLLSSSTLECISICSSVNEKCYIEQFSIECSKAKMKAITQANHNRNCLYVIPNWCKSQENVHVQNMMDFCSGFASHWLSK